MLIVIFSISFQFRLLMSHRDQPEVKDIDLLHAPDYGKMTLSALKKKMQEQKIRDSQIETSMLYVETKILMYIL